MDGRPSLDLRQASEALAIEALVADNGERSDPRRGRDGRARRTREPNDEEAYELENSGLLDGDERSGISDGEEDYRKATRRRHRIKADSDNDNEEEGSFAAIIRRAVPTTDDPTLPTLTLRVIVLGSVFCVIGAASSQVWYFRSNSASFSDLFVILVTYPLGKLAARWLPSRNLLGFELNPGPFSIKEHVLIGVLAKSGNGAAYASDLLAVNSLYFHRELHALAGVTLLLTTQLIGFGLSGLLQALLVRPAAMIWPNSLVTCSMYSTLHQTTGDQGSLRFFMLVFIATFGYQFLPGWLAPSLNSVPLLCLASSSVSARILGSGYDGLGFLDFSFDWSAIGASGPLYTPPWALACYLGGMATMLWVVTPILWFANIWDAQSFISPVTAGLFDAAHQKFDVAAILAPDLTLNETAWEGAAPLLLTPYFALSYALSFAALTSVITHVALFHGPEIRRALWSRKRVEDDEDEDIHNQLMRSYEPVPKSWFVGMITVNLAAMALLVTFAPLQTPLWALLLAIALAVVFLVPIGIVSAISGTTIGLNVISEFVIGVLRPGAPIGNVFFKCSCYMTMAQALDLTSDLKLALYLKIPYKKMMLAQVIGTVIGAVTNYFTLIQVIDAKRPYLDGTLVDPTGQWTGRAPAVFYSASIIWGAVSPVRFFAGKYRLLYLGFPLGIVVPVITYYLHRRFPSRGFDKFVFPIACSGATLIPAVPANILLSGILAALLFHGPVKTWFPRWTERRLLTLSAALDAGTSLSGLGVYLFFTVLLGGATAFTWALNPKGDAEHCRPAVT